MYLKSLVLKGFKSFADRSVLTLEPGITAIVGPNGSGKSNISDAVLWVLGERNAKNLRGQVMEDVIFSGSKARKSVSVAQVDLVLDNSDGELPLDFTEVTISRRMFRTGESDYLINGASVRRLDILDILHDTGLGTGTHSIISQGSLDGILQSRPEDRRALIEEAAGVLKHKQRKERSQRKIEQMDMHLLRVKDVVAEVERQLAPLERKAKRAIAYREVSSALADLNLRLAVDDLKGLQLSWDAAVAKEASLQQEILEITEQLTALEGESERLQEELQRKTTGAVEIANKARSLSVSEQRLQSSEALIEERLRNEEVRLQETRDRIEALSLGAAAGTTGEDAERLSLLLGEQEGVSQADALAKQTLAEASTRLRDLEASANALETKRKALREEGERLERIARQAREERAATQAKAETANQRASDIRASLEEARMQQARAADVLKQAQEDLNKAEQTETLRRGELDQANGLMTRLREESERLQRETAMLQIEIAGLRELETASRESAEALRSDAPDAAASPVLADVIEVDAGFGPLVDRLLKADAFSVIAANRACVLRIGAQVAKREAPGILSVLDADAPASRDAVAFAKARGCDAVIGHVRCEQKNENAVWALLGDVVLCDSLETALSLHDEAPSLRFVTPDGCMVWPSGKIMLGAEPAEGDGVISRRERLVSATASLSEAEAASRKAQADAEEAKLRIREANEAFALATKECAVARGILESAQRGKAEADRACGSLEAKSADAERAAADLMQALEESQSPAGGLEEERERLERESAELKELELDARAKLMQARETHASLQQQANAASVALAGVAERVKVLRSSLEEKRIQAERDSEHLGQARLRERAAVATIDRIGSVLPTLHDVVLACRACAKALDARIESARGENDEESARAARARNAVRMAREKLDEANQSLSAVRVEKGRLELQVNSAITTITEDCKVSLEVALSVEPLQDRDTAQAEALRLRKRIANMGTINPDAAEEYQRIKERFDFLNGQLSDLNQARASLQKIDRVIDERMRESFLETYRQVNGNFQEIFAQLFPGGQATLELIDPESPDTTGIEVKAQPVGKKITKMSLLSGGEKSLVALALLFAVYRKRSTPFYILDEVEAALDDTNLRRLIAYLDELRLKTQLIMITHQRRTMEMADTLFGVSMQSDGVTKVISQKLERALEYAEG